MTSQFIRIYFIRLDSFTDSTAIPGAMLAQITATETFLEIHPDPNAGTGLILNHGEYVYDDLLSWTQGLTSQIGKSQMLNYVFVGQHPTALYSYSLGWLLAPSGTAATGIYFYRMDTSNWIWTREDYGGFYWDYASQAWGTVF